MAPPPLPPQYTQPTPGEVAQVPVAVAPPVPAQPQQQAPGIVLACTSGFVLALSMFDGRELWRFCERSMGGTGTSVVQDSTGALWIGNSGYVWKASPVNGSVLWKGNLQGTGFNPVGMTIVPNALGTGEEIVFAASGGYLFAISTARTDILWVNKLKGCGRGFGLSVVPIPPPGMYGQPPISLAVGINGKVALVSPGGVLQKVCSLPGCGFGHVALVFDYTQGVLLAASQGHVYALQPNAEIIWHNDLPGMSLSYISISNAHCNTDLHACTSLGDWDEVMKHNN